MTLMKQEVIEESRGPAPTAAAEIGQRLANHDRAGAITYGHLRDVVRKAVGPSSVGQQELAGVAMSAGLHRAMDGDQVKINGVLERVLLNDAAVKELAECATDDERRNKIRALVKEYSTNEPF